MTDTNYSDPKFDEGFVEPAAAIIKFNKEGDVVKGTLTDISDFTGDYGTCKKYTIIAEAGQFHAGSKDKIDEKPTELTPEKEYSFLGHFTIDEKLQTAQLGQKIIVRHLGMVESKKRKGAHYKRLEAKLDTTFQPVPEEAQDDVPFA
jgi:hypothetical protein|tara:strand:+ start:1196 stop:1636 length:441 start_codon:yes stop_codon:yes gene_type:complete